MIDGLRRTDFCQFSLLEVVLVLKELFFFLNFQLGGCGGSEGSDFQSFSLERMWWS